MRKFKPLLFVLATLPLIQLTSCVSKPSPPAKVVHSDNYTAETKKVQRVIPPADRVLGLKEAIRIGLTNSPGYKQQQLAVQAAWATFYSAVSNYSPNLDLSWGAQTDPWLSTASGGAGTRSTTATSWAGNMGANWNVFNGLQTTMQALATRAKALSAEEIERDTRRILILSITTAYNQILLDRAKIQISLSDEEFNEQQLRDVELKYDAGASSLSDLLWFRIATKRAQDQVITDTSSYKIGRYVLAQLMGLTTAVLPETTEFPPIQVEENKEYELGVGFYLDLAIKNRPDLKATKLDLEALRYKLYSSWGAFSPTVDLGLNLGYNTTRNGYGGKVFPTNPDWNFNYGFGANWTIWQGGFRIAKVREAQAGLYFQEEELMKKWIDVVKSVRTAYTNLLANIAHAKVLKRTMGYALKRRDLTTEEYNAGNINLTVLNQAQRDLITAETKHIQAVLNVANARAELSAACGVNSLD